MTHGHPPGHRRRWDEADDSELRRRIGDGEYLGDLARAMGRTQEACRSRANILKLAVKSAPMRGRVAAATVVEPGEPTAA